MIKHGLVGFFDILGYQNIIDNNEIEDVSEIVSKLLKKIPDDVKKSLKKYFPDKYNDSFLQGVKIKLISDSLLLSLPIQNLEMGEIVKGTISFLEYVSLLCENMFNHGLPFRGAIAYGDYYLDKSCFAGKCIIDCYKIGESLELSGVVMNNNIYEGIIDLSYINPNKEYDKSDIQKIGDNKTDDLMEYEIYLKDKINQYMLNHWFEHLVPTKNGEIKYHMLKWCFDSKIDDVRQKVYNSFTSHKKNISIKDHNKLTNTELSIRAMLNLKINMDKK